MSESNPNRTMLPLVVALVAVIAVAAVAIGFLLGRSTNGAVDPVAASAPLPAREPASPAAQGAGASAREEAAPAVEAPEPATPVAGTRIRTRGAQESPVAPPVPEAEAQAPAPPAEPVEPPTPAAPETVALNVPAGTKISLELLDPVSSQTAAVGQPVRARVVETLRVDGRAAIPAGSAVSGRVTEVKALAKVGGQAHLAIAFDAVELPGGTEPIEAYFARTGKSETGKDAATIAAGAVVGTILGNQAKKNDRGKAIGAVVGAGVGTAIAASTDGEKIELAAGSVLELTLRSDVETIVRR